MKVTYVLKQSNNRKLQVSSELADSYKITKQNKIGILL